jgi:hypothetical protein
LANVLLSKGFALHLAVFALCNRHQLDLLG